MDWSLYLCGPNPPKFPSKPATGLTPFQFILGFQPPLFPVSETYQRPFGEWLDQRSEETWDQAHQHLRQAVRRQQLRQTDIGVRTQTITPDHGCGLSTRDLRLHLPCRKLSPRYVGPYQIRRQITPVSFELALPNHFRVSPTFHVSLLKPADDPEEGPEERRRRRAPYPSQWRVRRYTRSENSRFQARGRVLQYLVDWEGYGQRRGLGSTQRIFWTPAWWRISTETTRNDRPPDHAVDLGADHLLASGAARRGGGSVAESVPLAPSSGHQREPSPEY